VTVAQVPAPLPPPDIPPEVLAWLQRVPPELAILIPLAAVVIGGGLLFVLVRAIARRIEGGGGRAVREELEVLRQRLAELEEGQVRFAELEERIDFQERMLAQERRGQLPDSRHG
jgi:hypothetical protein